MSARVPIRLAATAIVAIAMVVAACSSGSPSQVPPSVPTHPANPTGSPVSAISALAALRNRAGFILQGTSQPRPLVLDWSGIENLTPLPKAQSSALCDALKVPKADDALATIALLALNAVSERFRHKPAISDPDTEALFTKAISFATNTCPAWQPSLASALGGVPAATPTAAKPLGVVGDPGLTWYLQDHRLVSCKALHPKCWRAEVRASAGCPDHLAIAFTVTDQTTGLVIGTTWLSSRGPWPAGVTGPFDIWHDGPGTYGGSIAAISCV